jgi:hypothetical protein
MDDAAFDTATYYDCVDSEEYSHETPEDAVEAYLDGFMTPNCDAEKTIRETLAGVGSEHLTVKAYNRSEVPPKWVDAVACQLVACANDAWREEYGDPDGDGFDAQATKYLGEEFARALQWVIAQEQVWACSKCGERRYTVEEVLALMRTHNPGWFTP